MPVLVKAFRLAVLASGAVIACLYFQSLADSRRIEASADESAHAGLVAAAIEARASGNRGELAPALLPAIDDSVPPAQRSGGASNVSPTPTIDWVEILNPELARIAELEDEPATTALVELAPMLASEDPAIRLAAIEAVGDMSITAAVTVLSMALDDSYPRVRVIALQALAERDDGSVSVDIEPRLYDQDAEVRLAAIDALAALEAKTAVHALASLLSDPTLSIRRRAVDALGDIGGDSAMRYLQQARHDPDETIRVNAAAILAELN